MPMCSLRPESGGGRRVAPAGCPWGWRRLRRCCLMRGEGRSYAVAGVVVAAMSLACAIGLAAVRAPRRPGRPDARAAAARHRLPGGFRGAGPARPRWRAGGGAGSLLGAGRSDDAATRRLHAGTLAEPAGRPGLRDTAYALEAWLQELFFVFGPLIAAAIAVVASPWAAVLGLLRLRAVGTIWFALIPAVRAAGDRPGSRLAQAPSVPRRCGP